jgi:hypothetical protein
VAIVHRPPSSALLQFAVDSASPTTVHAPLDRDMNAGEYLPPKGVKGACLWLVGCYLSFSFCGGGGAWHGIVRRNACSCEVHFNPSVAL